MSIIERLRAWAADHDEGHVLLRDAADRLEWFESAGGVTMATRIHAVMIENERLTAERDAARAEVARLADLVSGLGYADPSTSPVFAQRDAALALLRKAREPLAHWIHHDEGLFGLPRAEDVNLLAEIDTLLSEEDR